MGVNRSKRSDIYRQIVNVLRTGSYNILQISDKTGINWETVRNAVETLEKINFVSKESKNNRNYYSINPAQLVSFNENTFLGLPITKKQENSICSLAKRIIQKWTKSVPERPLRKTFLHKMLVKLVKEEKIRGIPYGWYLFGMCTVLQLELQTLIEGNYSAETRYDLKIESIIKEYSTIPNTKELLIKHYTEEGNDLYLTKLKISNLLMNRFDGDSINSLKINLRNLLFSFIKKEDNKEVIEYLNGFVSIVIRLIKNLSMDDLDDIRSEINDAFISVWEMVGTYNFYESILRFYDKQPIEKYYLIRIENLKSIAVNYLSELNDSIPIVEQKEDSFSRFKGILA